MRDFLISYLSGLAASFTFFILGQIRYSILRDSLKLEP